GIAASIILSDMHHDKVLRLVRLPIDKVHSLSTLASDVVCGLISNQIRMKITRDTNPRSVAELVNEII
ncbi:hypothetical protein PMAYCL1PPCAC_14144, partial [Pristionchus mayeri]